MGKLRNSEKSSKFQDENESHKHNQDEPSLVRRMSSSSEGARSEDSYLEKKNVVEGSRSLEGSRRRRFIPKFSDFFDWPFFNEAYNRMSPNNRRWLIYYKFLSYLGIIFIGIGYTYFIILLTTDLIHVDPGEITDEDLFQPVSESLLHSLSTLWHQQAYFVVFVILIFSISLPFVKMFATVISYLITSRYRKKQINIYFGKKYSIESHTKFFSQSSLNSASPAPPSSDTDNFAVYQDGKLIKYSREILLILKLISKFQMVDCVILLINISFLRSAFVWARPGLGLLYLFVYCTLSILGTQLLNQAVEGEKSIFDYWKAMRVMWMPAMTNYYTASYYGGHDKKDFRELEVNKSLEEVGYSENKGSLTEQEREVELMNKRVSSLKDNTKIYNILSKNSGLEVESNGTSEADYYELLYSNQKDMKVRWYRCDIFVSVLVLINIISGALILSKEKIFSIAFTPDKEKLFGVDGSQMTYVEIVLFLRDCWDLMPMFVLILLGIVVPVVFHTLFLVGLFMYNFAISDKGCESISRFDPGKPLIYPQKCLHFPVKMTKFIFSLCNVLSEWSLAEVISLGFLSGFIAMSTANNVLFQIPPKKIASAFPLIGSFGITSLLLNVQFFMWYRRIKHRLSNVTLYIESIHSTTNTTNSNNDSTNNLKEAESKKYNLTMIVKDQKDNIERLDSYIETNRNEEVMYEPEREKKRKRNKIKRTIFKIIDFIRHIMYSKFVTSLFFAILGVISIYFFIFSFVYTKHPSKVDAKKIQNFLDVGLPEVYKIAKKQIPKSYGNCEYKVTPPKPCKGGESIYQVKSPVLIDLVWMTGLNSGQIVESSFLVTETGRLQFRIHLKFGGLRPYIKLGFCTDRCHTLVAGDKFCCGDDLHVIVITSVRCNNQFPHMRDIKVDLITIENLKFLNELDFIFDYILKVETILEKQIMRIINDFFEKQDQFMVWRGVPMSLLDFMNFLMKLNFPAGIICPTED